MGEEIKEKVPILVPHAPAEKQDSAITAQKRGRVAKKVSFESSPGKSERENGGMAMPDEVGASNRKTRKRVRMKRHRPKVVDESKPVKPSTPEIQTPKRPRYVRKKVDTSKEAIRDRSEVSCKRKLEFNKESCIEDQNNLKPYTEIEDISEPKLRRSSTLTSLELYGTAEGPKIFKKRRMNRQKLSLDKLIKLIQMIQQKSSCKCGSTASSLTWINLKRRRSWTRTRRRDLSFFLPKGVQAVVTHKSVEQFEHPQEDVVGFEHMTAEKSVSKHPQDDLVGIQNAAKKTSVKQCKHSQVDAVFVNGNVRNCSAESAGDCTIGAGAETDILEQNLQFDTSFQQQEGIMCKCVGLSNEPKNIFSIQDDALKEALADFATQKMESLHIGDGSNQHEEKKNHLVVQDPKYQKPKIDLDEETKNQLKVDLDEETKKQLVVRGPKRKVDLDNEKKKQLVVRGPKRKVDLDKETKNQLVVRVPKHQKPQVDVDEETKRAFNLFMYGGGATEERDDDKKDENKSRLEEEKELFVGRVDSFIAAMFIFLGDRRFTRWKGSVVDSIVGVFLTQNVSDNLSSNAFMALAATYPPPSETEQDGHDGRIESIDSMSYETQQLETHEPLSGKSEESNPNNGFEKEVDNGNETSFTTKAMPGRTQKKVKKGNEIPIDWDILRRKYSDCKPGIRGDHNADSVNWEAIKQASVGELAKVIKERGMNNQLAGRIKNFLDRIVRDHGSIDLEWLRNVPPDEAKSYLMSMEGLALKSTECVRLLSLYQRAFPIDVNVGRALVRLGWVKLKPLPEGLPIHLLNDYPALATVQEYIWPRICNRDALTLYELHCYLNVFSKAFCTKSNPNCNACPMRGECKHYASALASSRVLLEGSQATNVTSDSCTEVNQEAMVIGNAAMLRKTPADHASEDHCQPIIEFPASPEPATTKPLGGDIEDFECDSEIPTIILNSHELSSDNPSKSWFYDENDTSRAVVALNPQVESIPLPKVKNVMRLRTEHSVYELPDSHPLLLGFEKRDPEDPCPYLLAIWTTDSFQESKKGCSCQEGSTSCSGEIVQYKQEERVKGTILIPCRTANRGRFPLNGTYFQINEVFADHESSQEPIYVPTEWIWNLRRPTLYCGTTITSICRGMSLRDIVYCFQKGYICIRGLDLKTRRPKLLSQRFHFCKSRQPAMDG